MRLRHLTVAMTALALGGLGAPQGAAAHPLGNFSINHLTQVSISSDRVDARYILDQAEIPTFQERGLSESEITSRKQAEVRRSLLLKVDGQSVPLVLSETPKLAFPSGQGGLKLTRLELRLRATVTNPRRVSVQDRTFSNRVGWKAIVARRGKGTAVRSSVPSGDPTGGLRTYPKDMLASPLDDRSASFAVKPGDGTLVAPKSELSATTTENRSGDGFAGIFSDAASGKGVLILLLFAAFGWGALHALSPGHGKAMVAAYLVGTRGTARHAVALGATVTFTHTIGVFLLGLVTLLLSQYILPEDLYPWLNFASGLLVLTVGLGVLRARLRRARRGHRHATGREHHQEHQEHQGHGHRHVHQHEEGEGHAQSHHHHMPDRVTWRGLVGMGVAAGLIPCPSALVVLLGAIAQHQIALGLLLIVAFSAGLAATLTALGLAVVYARRLTARIPVSGRLTTVLPAASAALIVGIGLVLTAQAIPHLA
jgi:nickel/cobalt exporter